MEVLYKELVQLVTDKDFLLMKSLYNDNDFSQQIHYKEEQMTNMLWWFLDPNEGHNLGDYFIQHLVRASFEQGAKILTKKDDDRTEEDIKLDWLSAGFQNAVFAKELTISNNQRIDLVIFDDYNEFIIIIERKDGTKAHSKQLEEYRKWVQCNFPDFSILCILSDSYGYDHGDQSDADYVQLDDSWWAEAIEQVMEYRELTPTQMHVFEKALYTLGYGEEFAYEPLAKNLVKKYSSLIDKLNCYDAKFKGKPIDYAVPQYLKEYQKIENVEWYVKQLLIRNHYPLQGLNDFDKFSELSDLVDNFATQTNVSIGTYISKNSTYMDIYPANLPMCKGDVYPFYLRIKTINNGDETNDKTFDLIIAFNNEELEPGSDGKQIDNPYIDKFMEVYDLNVKNKWFRHNLHSGITDLSLSESKIKSELKKFADLVAYF